MSKWPFHFVRPWQKQASKQPLYRIWRHDFGFEEQIFPNTAGMCLGWMTPGAWEWMEEVRSWPLTLCMQTVSGVSQLAFARVLNLDHFEKQKHLWHVKMTVIMENMSLFLALSCVCMRHSFKMASCYKLFSKSHRRRKRKMSWHTLTSSSGRFGKVSQLVFESHDPSLRPSFSLETASCLHASRLLI